MQSKHKLEKKINDATCEGFKITWKKRNINDNGVECTKEMENWGHEINDIWALESHALRDRAQRSIDYKVNNNVGAIFNSCDGAAHPVTRHCERTVLVQSI